jgi:hypothetical protein
LPIVDCRLTIEEAVRQQLPLAMGNRQSTIDNHQSSLPAVQQPF